MTREFLNSKKPIVIALVGKGGAGKTLISTLMTKIISEKYNLKLLLIDADPTHPHLCNMVDLTPRRSLEEIRTATIDKTIKNKESKLNIAKKLDFEIYDAMGESKKFCILSIGQPTDPGCFCPSNLLLKSVLKSITTEFDIILIDCEAGLEQITRKVIDNIDVLLIVSDISMRSIETANSIKKVAQKLIKFQKVGLILNKVKGNIDGLVKRVKQIGLPILGEVPYEDLITDLEIDSTPLIHISNESKALQAIEQLTDDILQN